MSLARDSGTNFISRGTNHDENHGLNWFSKGENRAKSKQ
jgi:hypothetical protein